MWLQVPAIQQGQYSTRCVSWDYPFILLFIIDGHTLVLPKYTLVSVVEDGTWWLRYDHLYWTVVLPNLQKTLCSCLLTHQLWIQFGVLINMWLIGIMLVQTGNQVFDVHIVENCSCLDIHVLSPFVGLFSQLSYSCGNCGNSWPLSQGTAAVFQAVSIEWNHCHSDRPVDWTETCHVQWPQDLLQTSQLHVTILISNYYSNVSMPIQASSSGNEWEISVWL